jgi:glucokinase-like ROK family protein
MAGQAGLRTGDQALVREINLAVIMDKLREQAPLSRAALAEMTGLNKTTVSSLVTELIEKQFVHEVGYQTSGIGRPAMLIELNPGAGFIVGVEIGVDFLSVLCTDFAAEVIGTHIEDVHRGAGQQAVIDRVIALLDRMITEQQVSHGRPLGIAVGVPGLVDSTSGTLLFAPNLKWRDVPLSAILRGQFPHIPLLVDNEANFAALGESYFGVAKGYSEVLYISAGMGLGGAIVRNDVLIKGKDGYAGEFGHMTIEPEGSLCNCGNWGCWETLVSQRALFQRVEQALASGAGSLLTADAAAPLTVKMLVEAAAQGDRVALEALEDTGQYLGIGIASLVNALNPDLVVFGGILSTAFDYLESAMQRALQQRALAWSREGVKVVRARHGFNACVMGGVAAVYQTVMAHPGLVIRQSGWHR